MQICYIFALVNQSKVYKRNDGTLADSRLTTSINNSLVGNARDNFQTARER